MAQALWKARRTLPAAALADLVARLRVYAIGDQYGMGSWLRDEFPELFYITAYKVFRGMYHGGDRELTAKEWLERHITSGQGPLGAAYPIYEGGDVYGKVSGVKEGDTPSFLYLIANGLSDPERPEWGNWGGRFVSASGRPHYTDARDDCPEAGHADAPYWQTVFRWREAYQASFQARMDWCRLPSGQAQREPVAVIDGELVRHVVSGSEVTLSARARSTRTADCLLIAGRCTGRPARTGANWTSRGATGRKLSLSRLLYKRRKRFTLF